MTHTSTEDAPVGFVHVSLLVKTCTFGALSDCDFAVGLAKSSHPMAMDLAVLDSCARVIVNVSVAMLVTRTISAAV
jgi:hypothetical protein